MACMQVIDAAMEAGADDVQPATGEDNMVEGFKVQGFLSLSSLFPCFPQGPMCSSESAGKAGYSQDSRSP